MEKTDMIGIDLAKNSFQLHWAAADGSVVFRRTLTKGQVLGFRNFHSDLWEQCCRVHKTANVTGAMPKSLHDRARVDLVDIWMTEIRKEAEAGCDPFVETHGVKCENFVDNQFKDRDRFMVFYVFPAEYRRHIRTTNPVESVLSTVRNHTRKIGVTPSSWSSGRWCLPRGDGDGSRDQSGCR